MKVECDRSVFRVWVVFDGSEPESSDPPEELLGQARLFLAGLKGEGLIDNFFVDQELFYATWRKMQIKARHRTVRVLIGRGWPQLSGVRVIRAEQHGMAGLLSVNATFKELGCWFSDWLVLKINEQLSQAGTKNHANPAVISGLQFLALRNRKAIRQEWFPPARAERKRQSYEIKTLKSRGMIELVLYHTEGLTDFVIARIASEVLEHGKVLCSRKNCLGFIETFDENLKSSLNLARSGAESLGFSLPRSLLGAIIVQYGFVDKELFETLSLLALIKLNPSIDRLSGQDALWGRRSLIAAKESLVAKGIVEVSAGDVLSCREDIHLPASFSSDQSHVDFYIEHIRAGQLALDLPSKLRTIEAMTLCISESEAQRILQKIDEFRSYLTKKYSSDGDRLYHLNLQFFPLTKLKPQYNRSKASDGGNWLNSVVRELVALDQFKSDPQWMAAMLLPEVSVRSVNQSFQFLHDSGLVRRNPQSGKFEQTQRSMRTDREVSGRFVVHFHKDMMEIAKFVLEQNLISTRGEVSVSFLSVSPGQLDLVKQDCFEFLSRVFEVSESTVGANQLFQLNLQLTPFLTP